MRVIAVLLIAALAAPAADLKNLHLIPLGHPVRLKMTDRSTAEGRLVAVEAKALTLQIPVSGGMMGEREVALADIRSVKEIKESEFGSSVKKSVGAAVGVLLVFAVLGVVGAILGG